ncbi:hypothetical protein HanIR_Chr02g0087711 [Helianthus annuus]|nr:hypothetical protein HanIR_Chr02g0087711 [Helianthus annuus]
MDSQKKNLKVSVQANEVVVQAKEAVIQANKVSVRCNTTNLIIFMANNLINSDEMNVVNDDYIQEYVVEFQGKKRGKFTNRADRVDWTSDEEVLLAKSYINISVDW